MKIISAYEMLYCPLFSVTQDDAELQRQNQQEELWKSAKRFAINQHGTPIELCFISDPQSQSVRTFVLLYFVDHSDVQRDELLNSFERILPDDYGWKHFYTTNGKREFESRQSLFKQVLVEQKLAQFDSYNWWSTTLQRRFATFDISPKLLTTGMYWNQPNTTTNTDTENQNSSALFPFDNLNTSELEKQFPRLPSLYTVKQQLRTNSISLPYHPAIKNTPCQRNFFQELLYSSPATISFFLSPPQFENHRFKKIHALASFARRILEPYHYLTNPSDSIPYSEVEQFYSDILGSQENLSQFSIKITTSDFARTQSLALSLIAPIGGTKIFEILPPAAGFSRPLSKEEKVELIQNYFRKIHIDTTDTNYQNWMILIATTPDVVNQDEADILLRLPIGTIEGLPGIEVRQPAPFATSTTNLVNINETKPDSIKLGQIKTAKVFDEKDNNNSFFHSIKLNQLCKHAFIVGSTGSGKTTTVQYLLKQIADAGIPFLVIEPSMKAEYFEQLKDHESLKGKLKRITIDNLCTDADNLCFDPFRLPPTNNSTPSRNITAAQHVSYLKSCFQAAFPIHELGAMILETCLMEYYDNIISNLSVKKLEHNERLYILNNENKTVCPSFADFNVAMKEILKKIFPYYNDPTKIKDDNWFDFFNRRFDNLKIGALGKVFQRADQKNRENPSWNFASEYLNSPIILELNTIPDREQQALLMAFLLTFIFEARQTEGVSNKNALKHVLVIEEAHRLLGRKSSSRDTQLSSGDSATAKAATMFSDMLAEIRAFGQSVFIAEQIPSKIIPDTLKNTNLKFLMRLTSAEDREFMGQSMNCSASQQKFVNTLKTGQAVVFEEGLDQPILLTIPEQ